MNTKRVSFRFDDEIYKMLEEIVEERNKYPELNFGKYDISSAIREGIVYTYNIEVNKTMELMPSKKLLETKK